MTTHADTLKSMLQDIINDRQEQASVTMHNYFVAKTREVAGMTTPVDPVDDETETDFENNQ